MNDPLDPFAPAEAQYIVLVTFTDDELAAYGPWPEKHLHNAQAFADESAGVGWPANVLQVQHPDTLELP